MLIVFFVSGYDSFSGLFLHILQVGSGFDTKELVFRNYLRFGQDTTALTLLVIWRDDNKESISPLTVRVFAPEASTSSTCNFNIPRSNLKNPLFPGLPGFRASFLDLDLSICAPTRSGAWNITVEGNLATISTATNAKALWKVVDVCGECVGHQCTAKPWSPTRVDRKSALGRFDSATGLLQLGGDSNAELLDIPI